MRISRNRPKTIFQGFPSNQPANKYQWPELLWETGTLEREEM